MRSSIIFREYVWLLTTIRDAGHISFDDISTRWSNASLNETGEPMARTTFNRHRTAIEEIFDVEIKCDRSLGNKYFIDDSNQIGSTEVTNWLCDSLITGTLLSNFKDLSNRISLERVPTADTKLRIILEGMKHNLAVSMSYHRICEEDRAYIIEPYAVKLFKQRWYLLGHIKESEGLRLFSFERITDISVTEQKFDIPEDFTADDHFRDIFGVMSASPDIQTQRVVLRAFGRDRFYLEELPLHPSQKVIETAEIYTDFELYLKPTPDLAAAILSRGGWVKVIEPQWFADNLIQRADFMVESFVTDFP